MEFREKLINKFSEYNVSLNETQVLQFEQYYNLLIEWNNKFNLTAITDEDEVIEKHFLDSVLPQALLGENAKVIDIGAGAGFPSIPLKIMRPDLSFILIDSVNKKVTFINEVISQLKLTNTTAIHTRIEDLAVNPAYRECFDICISRAVARLNTLSEYSLPFVKIGGDMLAYKSKQIDEELKEAKKVISLLGGTVKELAVNNFDDNDRNVVIINKTAASPKQYPRPKNLPRTKPIV